MYKRQHGDIEDADITKVAAFIKDMTGIGVLIPDDGLEDYIRQVGHLPDRTYSDTREIDRTRQEQQEQNQPPEPKTAAGAESDEEGEKIQNNKVEDAKKRLGR